ncbi:hypothetical protein AAMO2058_001510800, partial [Amorphochlora amoebiformis]
EKHSTFRTYHATSDPHKHMVLKREAVVLRNGDPNSHERVKERGNNHRRHQVGAHVHP